MRRLTRPVLLSVVIPFLLGVMALGQENDSRLDEKLLGSLQCGLTVAQPAISPGL